MAFCERFGKRENDVPEAAGFCVKEGQKQNGG